MCLSLGCPHSRKFGFVRDDTLIVGMPFHLAKKMVRADAQYRHHPYHRVKMGQQRKHFQIRRVSA